MTPAPPRWWLPIVLTSATVTAATLASLYAMRSVVARGDWWGDGVRVVLVLAAVTLTVRLVMTRSRLREHAALRFPAALVPTGIGLLAAAWMFLGAYGSPGDSFTPLVGLHAVERVGARLDVALGLIRSEVAPIDATLPIVMLVVGAAAVIFLVADLIAGGLHYPAVTGIAVLVLWIPALLITRDVPTGAFVVTTIALALTLAVDRPRRARAPRRAVPLRQRLAASATRVGGATAGAALVVVLALGVGSVSAGLAPLANTSWGSWFGATGSTVRLSADLDMRRNLNDRTSDVVLRYTTSGSSEGPLRVFTLTGFDGTNWHRGSDRDGTSVESPQEILWPTTYSGAADQAQVMRVTIGSLRDTKLPIVTDPRAVAADGSWNYEPLRDEVVGREPTHSGESYEMTVYPRDLDADVLRQASGPDPGDRAYTEVPATTHAEDIKALAEQVAGGEPTRYDQALALQTYFRDTNRFTYDPTIPPPDTDDAVWDFLSQRTGYCVQYATAMTIMARSLGIPARLAVGFLPGKQLSDGEYEVTGRDSHAWPEIYFPTVGWVRFEPTPAQQTGAAPSWAVPVRADSRNPADRGEVPTATSSTRATPSATASRTVDAGAPAPSGRADLSPWVTGAVVVVVIVLLVVAGLAVRRRLRGAEAVHDAESAWAAVRRSAKDLGVEWPSSTTPRQVPAVVAERAERRWGAHVDLESLAALARAVQDIRYAPAPQAVDPGQLRQWVEETVATLTAARDERVSARPAPDDDPSALRAG